MTFDERSEKNIATLHPRVQKKAREFMRLVVPLMKQKGVDVRIISGLRTYAEQDALYAKGRTTPGPKVTNARAGFSNHNFSTAWDIGLFNGKMYIPESPLYKEIGEMSRSLGLVWGGDFKSFKDYPHYEVPTGLTMAQMRERVSQSKDIFA
jgi:peptidoglycan L-alanyl-D-glutamate endopeptidase CwlK